MAGYPDFAGFNGTGALSEKGTAGERGSTLSELPHAAQYPWFWQQWRAI
jgi:hypothetical protein